MEFLNKTVSSLFEDFYEVHVAPHIDSMEVTFHEILDGTPSIRGGRHIENGYNAISLNTVDVHVRTSLADAEFEHTLAHELLHVASHGRRFPEPKRAPGISVANPAISIVNDLRTIGCVANDQLLGSLEFGPNPLFATRSQALIERISEFRAEDDVSRPRAAKITIHYVRALLDSGPAAMSSVRATLRLNRLPRIERIGDELYLGISKLDLQDHDQRLRALVLVRDTLGLKGLVDIIEPGNHVEIH